MSINETYTLRDYPCLYYLSDRLSKSDLCTFYCALGSIFDVSQEELSKASILFARISHGILFDDGYSEELIKEKSTLFKPFSDCNTLCKWKYIANTDKAKNMKHECCVICPLSTTFKNARMDYERMCLRYTIFTGKLISIESKHFTSMISIEPGNDLSVYGAIPLYRILNDFLISTNPHGSFDKDELIKSFNEYYFAEYKQNDELHKAHSLKFIAREINSLYTYDKSLLSESEANLCYLRLMGEYTYKPPIVAKTDNIGEKPNPIPFKEKRKKKSPSTDFVQESILSLNENLKGPVKPDATPVIEEQLPCDISISKQVKEGGRNSFEIKESSIPLPETDEIKCLENLITAPGQPLIEANLCDIESDRLTDSSIDGLVEPLKDNSNATSQETISFSSDTIQINADNTNRCISNTNDDNTNTECIPNDYILNTVFKDTTIENDTDSPDELVSLDYPFYKIPKSFSAVINNCASNDPKVVFKFITDLCTSHYIAVESVIYNSSNGLLIQTSATNDFYYFDIENASSSYLYPVLSDATKLKFLSLNPLPVISMLHRLGFNMVQVESLSGLYCLLNSLQDIYDYADLFDDILGIINEDKLDFYQYYMPHYEAFYLALIEQLEKKENIDKKQDYERGSRLDYVLGTSYDLSDILLEQHMAVTGHGFYDYNFTYNKDIPIICPGVMYMIDLPSLVNINEIKACRFLENISISLSRMPYQCVQYAKLLTIGKTGVLYYSTMDSDMFLDLLLDVFRRNYKKIYNEMPVLKTNRIEFK